MRKSNGIRKLQVKAGSQAKNSTFQTKAF